MKLLNDNFYARVFLGAFIWNVCIGFTGVIFTDFSIALFFGDNAITGDFVANIFFRLFMVAVIIFGAGYYLVSRELMLNRGIIILGLASKIILFVIFMFFYISGKATIIAALAVTGDFLWSLLFIIFLKETLNRVKINSLVG